MGNSRILIYVCSTFFLLVGSIIAHGQNTQIFAIGTKDGSFKEFIHNREPEKGTLYRVGENSPDKDWYAYQPGPLDSSVGRSTMQRDWMSVKPPASDPFSRPSRLSSRCRRRRRELSSFTWMRSLDIAGPLRHVMRFRSMENLRRAINCLRIPRQTFGGPTAARAMATCNILDTNLSTCSCLHQLSAWAATRCLCNVWRASEFSTMT